ncbi:acyltransferase domain-containing protein, partial [Nocardia otitidiscaviarum]
DTLRNHLTHHPDLDIAALNGPQSTVVAGSPQPLEELLSTLEQREIRVRRIPVDYASHTAHVDGIRAELDAALANIAPRQGRIAFYSTVTGTRLDGTQLTPDYWFRNLRHTV